MAKNTFNRCRRITSFMLSLVLVLSCMAPVSAAETHGSGVTATYDEAYYATLDYYGNLTQGSVVKSYIMNGTTSITDYGDYDEVLNLTDSTQPAEGDGSTQFRFEEGSAPSHFYFEGKTEAPFENLPWTISITYLLNGVPVSAEELPGKAGVVEIHADVIPNENASDYARHNYTLESMAMFNQDSILSLDAPGAQIQLIGNLRAVLFLALPGEEQHFVIRVGTDCFSFDGLTFLMVPATLSQLDQIAKLGEKKDALEQDYKQLSGSMDQLLGSFGALGGSLRATADGLDQLNDARQTISDHKDLLNQQADQVLSQLGALQGSMDRLPAHVDSAEAAVDGVSDALSSVDGAAVSMRTDITELDQALSSLEKDLQSMAASGSHSEEDLNKLSQDLDYLRKKLNETRDSLHSLQVEISGQALIGLPLGIKHYVKVSGKPLDKLILEADAGILVLSKGWDLVSQGQDTIDCKSFASAALLKKETADAIYTAVCGSTDVSMDRAQFFTAMIMCKSVIGSESPDKVIANTEEYRKQANALFELEQYHGTEEIEGLMPHMSAFMEHMGGSGLSGDLSGLLGNTGNALRDLAGLSAPARDILTRLDTILADADKLDKAIVNGLPELRDTLGDTRDLLTGLSSTTDSTCTFLNTFRNVIDKAGDRLDSGTQQTLENLAALLRKTASSTDAVGGVQNAKDSVDAIVEDVWSEFSGEANNLLMMDSTAEAQSLTSSENPAPTSVQVLIRTQEIKLPAAAEEDSVPAPAPATTFWGRVIQMFRDFGHAISGLFH